MFLVHGFWFFNNWVIRNSRYPGVFESQIFSINLEKLICCMKYTNISDISEKMTHKLVTKLVQLH